MRTAAMLAVVVVLGLAPSANAQEDAGANKGTGLFGVATDQSCIGGHKPFAADTTARVRGLSELTLRKYLDLAGSGAAVDARSVFTTKKTELGWSDGYAKKKVVPSWTRDGQAGDIVSIDDPVARAIATTGGVAKALLKTEQFLIAGAKLSAMGLWRVAVPSDPTKTIGWYRARFMRHNTPGSQAWDLISLELVTGEAKPAEILQYCVEPGDVERNRVRVQEKKSERLRVKAERESRRKQK